MTMTMTMMVEGGVKSNCHLKCTQIRQNLSTEEDE